MKNQLEFVNSLTQKPLFRDFPRFVKPDSIFRLFGGEMSNLGLQMWPDNKSVAIFEMNNQKAFNSMFRSIFSMQIDFSQLQDKIWILKPKSGLNEKPNAVFKISDSKGEKILDC